MLKLKIDLYTCILRELSVKKVPVFKQGKFSSNGYGKQKG